MPGVFERCPAFRGNDEGTPAQASGRLRCDGAGSPIGCRYSRKPLALNTSRTGCERMNFRKSSASGLFFDADMIAP